MKRIMVGSDAYDFPDTMSDGEVEKAMRGLFPSAPVPKEESTLRKIANATLDYVGGAYDAPEAEVSFNRQGQMIGNEAGRKTGKQIMKDTDTGDPGIMSDPVTAVPLAVLGAMPAVRGAMLGGMALKGALGIGAKVAGREFTGMLTGGVSEIPMALKSLVGYGSKKMAERSANQAFDAAGHVPQASKLAEEAAASRSIYNTAPLSSADNAGTLSPSAVSTGFVPGAAAKAFPMADDVMGTLRADAGIMTKSTGMVEDVAKPGFVDDFVEAPKADSLDSLIPEIKGGAAQQVGKYAEGSAINLNNLSTENQIKGFMNARTAEIEAQIGKSATPNEDLIRQAEELGWNADDAIKVFNEKGTFKAAEALAARQMNLDSVSNLYNKIQSLPSSSIGMTPELRAQFHDAMELVKVTSRAASESGKALQAHKIVLSTDPANKAFEQVMKKISGPENAAKMDEIIDKLKDVDFTDPRKVAEFVDDVQSTKWEKYFKSQFDVWINGLLSSPKTHIVNMTSNAASMLYTIPERLLGAGIEAVRAGATGTKRGIYAGETIQELKSMPGNVLRGVDRAVDVFKKGEVGQLERAADNLPKFIPEAIRKVAPTKMLSVEDGFFKGMIEGNEINRLAYRKASEEGLQGAAHASRISELVAKPTDDMLAAAAKRGTYLTFQRELGNVGNTIMKFRDYVPGLKYVVPFVKTPLNIFKFGIERSPLEFAFIIHKARKGTLSGAELSEQLAKPLMGTLLASSVYQLADNGYVTGGAPVDPKERAEKLSTGWQPYSFKIGDSYYSYARMEPFASIFGPAADLNQIKHGIDEDAKFKLGGTLLKALTTNFLDKTFMQGLSSVFNAISDPGRYGETFIGNLIGSAVPAVVGAVTRANDPMVRDTNGGSLVGDVQNKLMSRIPGLSEQLPVKLDVWGDPMERPGTPMSRFISPIEVSQEKGTLLQKEMLKLNFDVGYPSRKIGDTELTPNEYWEFVARSGQRAKDALEKTVAKPEWEKQSKEYKTKYIKMIVDASRSLERNALKARLQQQGRQIKKQIDY